MSELRQVSFHGAHIIVTDDQLVALRPVCEAMGLDYPSQYKRLQRTSWATVVMMTTVGADGKSREMPPRRRVGGRLKWDVRQLDAYAAGRRWRRPA